MPTQPPEKPESLGLLKVGLRPMSNTVFSSIYVRIVIRSRQIISGMGLNASGENARAKGGKNES